MTTDERRFAAIGLAERFWELAWAQSADLGALRGLLVPDVVATCGGLDLLGVEPLERWLGGFRKQVGSVESRAEETFACVDATRVATRWRVRRTDGGDLTGLSIWSVQWDRSTPRLARVWIEHGPSD